MKTKKTTHGKKCLGIFSNAFYLKFIDLARLTFHRTPKKSETKNKPS